MDTNEFAGVPEDQDASQGQSGIAADNGSQAQQQKPVDWTNDPNYRRLQSEQDRKFAQIQNQLKRLEQENALYKNVLSGADESVAQQLAREAQQIQLQAEVEEARRIKAEYEAQQQVVAWREMQRAEAQRMGIETNTPDFERALDRAVQSGTYSPILEYATQRLKNAAPPPVQREPVQTHGTPPPGGGLTSKDETVNNAAKRESYLKQIAEARAGRRYEEVNKILVAAQKEGITLSG